MLQQDMSSSVTGDDQGGGQPSPEALLQAAKWFDWPDSKTRLAEAFDEFARQAVEKERQRCRQLARQVETEWRDPPARMAARQVGQRIVKGSQP